MAITKTKEKILNYLKHNGETSPHNLVRYLGISPQALYRHLKSLLLSDQIKKIGSSPKVFYKISTTQKQPQAIIVSESDKLFLQEYFYFVSPVGESFEGLDAMIAWCRRHNLSVQKTINDYKKTQFKYNKLKKEQFIDGISKMDATFETVFLNKLLYLDFYAIERFGKTKLGYYLLYSKQGQSLSFMKELICLIKPRIQELINTNPFDAIGFVPPTVKREFQIMKMIQEECNFGLRILKIEKLKTPIIVPQKTLSKLNDRIANAKNTMLVTETQSFDRVLLIDDAIGSGATLNEIAAQIKKKKITNHVTGLALTGSVKGFDIISEV